MTYSQIVTGSFAIAWRHKYLWLLALFAGEAGGSSVSFPTSGAFPPRSGGSVPNFSGAAQQVSSWVGDHIDLIAVLLAVWLVLIVAFFVLGAICEGATVRASAEHDADRPFGVGPAWRCGIRTVGAIIRLRLLLLALGVPVFVVLAALAAGAIALFLGRNVGLGVALVLVGVIAIFAAIPYTIYLSLLNRLGARAAVLEELGARAALVRAHRLVRHWLGRVLLVWLLSIAVGFGVGIVLAIAVTVIALPLVVLGAAAYASGSGALPAVIVIGVLVLVPVSLVAGAFTAAQESTYWTLAFRRLELEVPA